MTQMNLQTQLIADIIALRVVLQQAIGAISLLAGPNNNFLQAMRDGALEALTKNEIQAPGIDIDQLRARAEFSIDVIFDSLDVTHSPKSQG